MNRALYIGATSMVANQRRMDVLTNNLANVNTTGYKKDMSVHESFPEKLLAKKSRIPERNNRLPDGGFRFRQEEGAYVASTRDGFFQMETKRGISHVKDIRVAPDEEGYLKTFYNDGRGKRYDYENYLLDASGQRIQVQGGEVEAVIQGAVMNPLPFVIGTMSRGVRFQKVVTDYSMGNFIHTENPLDFALSAGGFFKVMEPSTGDVFYTRNGSFGVSNGQLKDLQGRLVLGGGSPISIPPEYSQENLVLADDGRLLYNDEEIATLDVVDIQNREMLRKFGENLFKMVERWDESPDGREVAFEIPYTGEIIQGYLESSNVNAIDSMVEMITLQRDYDTNQRMVRTSDEMLEKAATQLASIG
ncbi:MAG: flagellar biosynthesis protein FlgE [Tissierellia bacterium]|nr:flagellar biosynthesis protein FlgE [Tissierellia bacterium]